jgi:hypothetical protein
MDSIPANQPLKIEAAEKGLSAVPARGRPSLPDIMTMLGLRRRQLN